ncbi:MAG: hypothetical protein PVS3B2_00210 [Candidatus Dormibacteraceae bacterium]
MAERKNPLAKANEVKKARARRTSKMTEALAAAGGILPREVMLKAMRDLVAEAEKAKTPATRRRLMRAAADVAKDAAPYVHPKLQSIVHEGGDKPIQYTEIRRTVVRPGEA